MVFILVLGMLELVVFAQPGSRAFGQTAPTPTPGGPSIQFLNPSSGTSLELSTKPDPTATFHLVAWVNALPPSPSVEFKYKSSQAGAEETTIPGSVTQVGEDTFELTWDLAGAGPEGPDDVGPTGITRGTSGTLKAVLSSGGTEVARDEETVRINQQTPPACPPPDTANNRACEDEAQGNTVELTYPVNGGGLGYYIPNPGQGPVNSVFDVTSSEGTGNVQSFYTVSRPGTEPQWRPCKRGTSSASETRAESADGIRCEYDAADNASRVTAVAVRATDTHMSLTGTEASNIDAADAHRSLPYDQDASKVLLLPAAQEAETGRCSPVITARVVDQAQPPRKIADINVDVHAAGPSDGLSFDDSNGTYSSTNKAPENHPSESAVDCETATNPPFSESQSDHEIPNASDIKHIESLTDTSDAGEWTFALYSPDVGDTQFSVWADEDGNDKYCSNEAFGHGSTGWDTDAPTPVGLPGEESVCPRPLPSGSVPTPTPASSPSGTPTFSPTPQEQRTLTLAVKESEATAGGTITLGGQLFASGGINCIDNEFIQITRRDQGTRSAEPLTTAQTNTNGRFEVDVTVNKSADYQATAPSHDLCAEAFSSPVSTRVHVRISIRANDVTPVRFDTIKISVSVRPNHRGTKVVLQRRVFGRWIRLDAKKLAANSVAIFKVEAGFRVHNFRAIWNTQDDDHESNTSERLHVETHKRKRKKAS